MKKTVMIVDDQESMRQIMKANMEMEGYDTITASDGMHALQLIRNRRPDLILLDLNMPAATGEKVYDRLKMMFPTKDIPIIFITAETKENMASMVQERNISMEDIFLKPVNYNLLFLRIRDLLS